MNQTSDAVIDEPLRPGTHYRTEFFRERGTIRTDGLVLDVGGRDGRTMSELGVERGVLVDVELSPRSSSVSYAKGSGTSLPIADGAADVVISLDVIEHVDDDAALVAELVRVLRPGGQLVLTTPHEDIRVLPGPAQKFIDRSRVIFEQSTGREYDHIIHRKLRGALGDRRDEQFKQIVVKKEPTLDE